METRSYRELFRLQHVENPPTHIELLKYFGTSLSDDDFVALLRMSMQDKGYDLSILHKIAVNGGGFGDFFTSNVLRRREADLEGRVDDLARRAFSEQGDLEVLSYDGYSVSYRGLPEQNHAVDSSIGRSPYRGGTFEGVIGHGASTHFAVGSHELYGIDPYIEATPVTILGGGVSGLMVVRTLLSMGWHRDVITVIDRMGTYGGIWEYKNVAGLSRNNPRALDYLGGRLEAAPGSGEEIVHFIQQLEQRIGKRRAPRPIKGTVVSVQPGDLDTVVSYEVSGERKTIRSPLVVNAIGLGSPLPLSRNGCMKTSMKARDTGPRWQQIITEEQAQEYRGKRLVFVGLGNSTAEMLVQLRHWQRRGHDIDYRVLTHLPLEALLRPDTYVQRHGKPVRLFRDLSLPNLVDLTGDLPEVRDAYFSALREGKIISDVHRWDVKGKVLNVQQRGGLKLHIPFDRIHTLIGYGHSRKVLENMGLVVDSDTRTPLYDYDGEFQREPGAEGRGRVHAGYFGIGPVLRSPANENAIVIPGTIHRIGDLLFGLTMRAVEYHKRLSAKARKRRTK